MKIKRAKRRISSLFICLILGLTLLSAGVGIVAAADPIVSIKPAVTDVNVSEDFSVFIEVDPNGNTVETALLNLSFDQTKVSIIDVVMNGVDFPVNDPGDPTVAGQITNIMGLSFTGLTTAANLAEIQMHADATGTFTAGISGKLTQPPGDPLTPVTMNPGVVRIKIPGEPLEVTVLYPNGGESIPVGTQVQVSAHATDDNAVTSVTFYYSNNSGSNWNLIGAGAIVSGTDKDGIWNKTWNTNGLSAGTNYLIKAVASDGTHTDEDQSNSTFSLTTCTPPSTPTLNDPGTTDTDGSYTVSWSSISGAANYTLEEDTSSSFSSPTVVYSGAGTSTGITGRSNGTYYYRVKACNASCGCSGWSNVEDIVVEIPDGNIITVDDSGGADYRKIQDAIANASSGCTIKVFSGTYNEHVVIDKSLKLIGVGKNSTIIDGGGSGKCVHVTADNIEIRGFTIKNGIYGVYLESSDGCIIDNNIILDNYDGVYLTNSNNNSITHNSLSNNILYLSGIHLSSSHNNAISDNDIFENDRGVSLYNSHNNLVYHNNFINNTEQAYDNTGTNSWDTGPLGGGNYWSYHSCIGNPSDGSQPYYIDSDSVDYYPFQDPNGWLIVPEYGVEITVTCTEKTVAPGEIASYLLMVKNIGAYNDSYTLSTDTTADLDVVELSSGAILLEPGTTGDVLLNVSDGTEGEYIVSITATSQGNTSVSDEVMTKTIVSEPTAGFDTDSPSNPYPSLPGTHTGTIKPNQGITVQKLYTYPCAGTGGHTEYIRIYGNEIDESASWNGYAEDWDTLTFDSSFTLKAGKTYNYVIKTGSYPQIHHTPALLTDNGWINCTKFTDANGKRYSDWIPAIILA